MPPKNEKTETSPGDPTPPEPTPGSTPDDLLARIAEIEAREAAREAELQNHIRELNEREAEREIELQAKQLQLEAAEAALGSIGDFEQERVEIEGGDVEVLVLRDITFSVGSTIGGGGDIRGRLKKGARALVPPEVAHVLRDADAVMLLYADLLPPRRGVELVDAEAYTGPWNGEPVNA